MEYICVLVFVIVEFDFDISLNLILKFCRHRGERDEKIK